MEDGIIIGIRVNPPRWPKTLRIDDNDIREGIGGTVDIGSLDEQDFAALVVDFREHWETRRAAHLLAQVKGAK